ncbi:MAG: LemA family protein, partial [Solirubrobacteraceae bacterium]|nr:LemA family protein [Solirubrobacteraceae bacterium]
MLEALGILVVLAVLIGVWVAAMYNRLRALQYACADAWSLVDVQLQRRADLVPNLVATVRAYAAHERSILEAVTAARAQADPMHEPSVAHARAEVQLSAAIARTVALREQYPQLAAATNFTQLQRTLADLENEIAASREIYNGNVAAYRDRLGQWPSSMVAKQYRFEDRPLFQLELAIERAPSTVVL